jgi:hypothetical protein
MVIYIWVYNPSWNSNMYVPLHFILRDLFIYLLWLKSKVYVSESFFTLSPPAGCYNFPNFELIGLLSTIWCIVVIDYVDLYWDALVKTRVLSVLCELGVNLVFMNLLNPRNNPNEIWLVRKEYGINVILKQFGRGDGRQRRFGSWGAC